ncbi:carboxy terminal-processing peptidase [Marinomonas sp. C2222]|uniref:Carboxy terminal-processing peptidase n=1 Tax=Marinomonas sargassi TaxID=2984494 RepID=A0ABT2YR75_9GAMM|nr:carboxy terminal-processing peptidase [Marinomonas sargassi]MCV2402381.1 carboxy terminal-processing peptidase [Marinomonas sargassi]
MNYKRLLLSLLTGYALVSTPSFASEGLHPPHEYDQVSQELISMLEGIHYNRPEIDDSISEQAFDNYIDSLDPTKSFFLKADIELLSQHKTSFDDALRNGDTQVAYTIYNLYLKRLEKRLKGLQENLPEMVKGFDYTIDETYNADPESISWANTEEELDEIWRKRIKNRALVLKLNGEDEEKIISTIERRYKNQIKQVDQTNAVDIYQAFVNSVTAALDPHTSYLAPRASETFNINMSLSLEGIGAVLQMDDDYTKVVRLVPGGPAATQSDLSPNERIVAVGQEGEAMIDVVGMRLDDVVDMIRGERDTKVTLEVTSSKGDAQSSRLIEIVRKKVKLEDQSAQKEIVEIERDGEAYKVGVISLPTFYSDFAAIQAGEKDYKSSTKDTKKLIEELREEGITALILDLRNNGGGSLQEANSLTGLFIPSGPTVQIRDQAGRVTPLGDFDKGLAYSGPMAVLINRMSASASEIVAGALQDYGRAIILGDQTFGKGTVQVLKGLDKGQLKVTQAKFYRVSGESTQHKGVVPDIFFPSLIDKEEVGESALDNPLKWDHIHDTRYPVYWNIPAYVPLLSPRHEERMATNPNFIAINEQIKEYKLQAESYKNLSLNEEVRKQQREASKERQLARENTRREALGLELLESVDDIEPTEEDTYAEEASEILLDFIAINQQQEAQKKTAQNN